MYLRDQTLRPSDIIMWQASVWGPLSMETTCGAELYETAQKHEGHESIESPSCCAQVHHDLKRTRQGSNLVISSFSSLGDCHHCTALVLSEFRRHDDAVPQPLWKGTGAIQAALLLPQASTRPPCGTSRLSCDRVSRQGAKNHLTSLQTLGSA